MNFFFANLGKNREKHIFLTYWKTDNRVAKSIKNFNISEVLSNIFELNFVSQKASCNEDVNRIFFVKRHEERDYFTREIKIKWNYVYIPYQ